MSQAEVIRGCWERTVRGLTKRPQLAKVGRSVTARVGDGLSCEILAEGFRLVADMPEIAGGGDTGPVPSQYLEAALASCLAIGYRMSFAAREIPVRAIEVEVSTMFDVRAMYGVEGGPLGCDGPLRYSVRVDSPAQETTVMEALDWVDAHSPLIEILTKPVELSREVRLTGGEG